MVFEERAEKVDVLEVEEHARTSLVIGNRMKRCDDYLGRNWEYLLHEDNVGELTIPWFKLLRQVLAPFFQPTVQLTQLLKLHSFPA